MFYWENKKKHIKQFVFLYNLILLIFMLFRKTCIDIFRGWKKKYLFLYEKNITIRKKILQNNITARHADFLTSDFVVCDLENWIWNILNDLIFDPLKIFYSCSKTSFFLNNCACVWYPTKYSAIKTWIKLSKTEFIIFFVGTIKKLSLLIEKYPVRNKRINILSNKNWNSTNKRIIVIAV